MILFNFHHIAFDGNSIDLFLDDLQLAYTKNHYENLLLQYIDYSVQERELDTSAAEEYWKDLLNDYDADKSLQLGYSNIVNGKSATRQLRTGKGSSFQFQLDHDVIHHMFKHANEAQTTMFQLGLTTYYLFLYKLTNGDVDLCVGSIHLNRYRYELKNLIGMFANTLPYRLRLDPTAPFYRTLLKVKQMSLEIFQNSYLPYQNILQLIQKQQRHKLLLALLIQTTFHFESSSNQEFIDLDDALLCQLKNTNLISFTKNASQFDLTLSMNHDIHRQSLSCLFEYSADLFDEQTIKLMAEQYQILLMQLFSPTSSFDLKTKPVYELSILLPYEMQFINELQRADVDFRHRKQNIYEAFLQRVMEHPQKLAIILDEQSLTYSEALHCVQHLSIHLNQQCGVKHGQIVCQCVERSVEMVIGILAILACGSCYCPLNPNDPELRLQSLVKSTETSCLLVHSQTFKQFENLNSQHISNIVDVTEFIITNFLQLCSNDQADTLSNLDMSIQDFSFIIFTSGSTGAPKAIQISQENFMSYNDSYYSLKVWSQNDNIIQLAQSSYDVHIGEIVGSLIKGASLIMLHVNGNLDMSYLSAVIQEKQITSLEIVPMLALLLGEFLENLNQPHRLKSLRSIIFGGMS
ncbi:unnamed protein product [Rotaria sp. Silwood2]|nr:unnamed protein product [Rotaria sp. Silwood2]CAF4304648.1 unnamed protein product [Rotaria sp. Silwood2]